MRILNRVIIAGALAVPMALGASGVAVAGVAAGSSVPTIQIGASSDYPADECGGSYPCENTDICKVEGDGFLEGLLNEFLGIGKDAEDSPCGADGTKFTD